MKGRLSPVKAGIVGLMVVITLAGGASANQPAHGHYLALGDSVAAGQGARVPDRFGYVGLFSQFYRVDHRGTERFDNLAVPGETSASFFDSQMARALEEINDSGSEVEVVTLTIGANDFLPLLRSEPCASDPAGGDCQRRVGEALNAFADNYRDALNQLNTALADAPGQGRVLVTTYYNPFDGTGAAVEGPVDAVLLGNDGSIDCAANASDPNREGLNDITACVGEQLGAEIVDIYTLFSDSAATLTHITEDDTHPNNDGHRSIADAVIAVYQGG